MLNPGSLPVPLKPYSLFSPSPSLKGVRGSQVRHTPHQIAVAQIVPEKQKDRQISRPIKIVNTHTMFEQIGWFRTENCYEALVKIAIQFILVFMSFIIGLIGITLAIQLFVFSVMLTCSQQNIFRHKLWIWSKLVLLLSTLVLSNYIFLDLISALHSKIHQVLYSSSLSLVPSLLITFVLFSIYQMQALIQIQYHRNFYQCFLNWVNSCKQVFQGLWTLKREIVIVYAFCFLSFYLIAAIFWLNQILYYSTNFVSLIHPLVFIAQILTIMIMILIYHFLVYFINHIFFWKLTPIFCTTQNHLTKIPVMLQLLRVASTDEMKKQLIINNVFSYFNLFSLADSRRENGVTVREKLNINKHCLAWIINYVLEKGVCLTNRKSMYSNASVNQVYDPKNSISYWDIVCQFAFNHFGKTLQLIQSIITKMEQTNIQQAKNKPFSQDIFYHAKVIKKQAELTIAALRCAPFLQICEYIFQIITICQIDFGVEVGNSKLVLNQIQQIRYLAAKISKICWASQAIRNKMKRIQNKAAYILWKQEK